MRASRAFWICSAAMVLVVGVRASQNASTSFDAGDAVNRSGTAVAIHLKADTAYAAAQAPVAPNPGRFPVHRLNRVEYVNAIHDVLALDIDGGALLPADNSGLGFDNNADVLSVTPALMARYMSAATKISRLAIGDPSIRPVKQVYAASQFGRQESRASEDLVFGTHGGFAIRHPFPLDGEYTFKIQ